MLLSEIKYFKLSLSFTFYRLDQLETLLLQKNKLTYLPRALVNMPKLTLLVVSGDDLVEIPTAVCESTTGLK